MEITLGNMKLRPSYPLPRHPDDMTSSKHPAAIGNVHHLTLHLGNPDTTMVTGEPDVVAQPTQSDDRSH